MNVDAKARELGIDLDNALNNEYLNLAVRSGSQIITSGHVSKIKGKLGQDLSVEQGYEAAKESIIDVLASVKRANGGTLDNLRVLKLLGCVNSTADFTDHHLVVNGASDLIHQLFGKPGDGFHARSALGFASLPTGPAVEIEAIFEIKT